MTTRRFCDACRLLRPEDRPNAARPEVPPDTPRCRDCGAVAGLAFGGFDEPDEAGRCPSCAAWQRRRAEHERMTRAGYTRRGGMWVRDWEPPAWPRRSPDGLLPVNAAAAMCGIKPSTLYAWLRRGLVGVTLGAGDVRYVRRDEVERAKRERP